MFTIYAVVEGQTEERFLTSFLDPAFFHAKAATIIPILLGNSGPRGNRGGKVNADRVHTHLHRLIAQHGHRPQVGFTTLLDLYRLPPDFPGNNPALASLARAQSIEAQLAAALPHRAFVPYIQVHEFEALLFSQPSAFATVFPDTPEQQAQLDAIASRFSSPEDINHGQTTSPAQRIATVYPQFEKVAHGPQIAANIGLPVLLERCPHFADWLSRLSQLLPPPS